jgi:FAD/FMN-containing dehydrogenase
VPHLVPAEFKGTLILPDDPRYDAARRVWNGRIDRRPALIARCLDAQDVRAGLLFAREHCLPLAVQGGGHSCATTEISHP